MRCSATLAAVPESQSVVVEKFGIDVTVKLVNHPNNEIAAAAVTLIGNLGLDDFYTNTIMEEHGFDQVMKLVKDRKDVKVIIRSVVSADGRTITKGLIAPFRSPAPSRSLSETSPGRKCGL
jgi:hypothetical protein